MRYLLLLTLLAIVAVSWNACKTPRYNLEEYKGPRLYFGSGGGFTGAFSEYLLLPNGQLYLSHNGGEFVAQSKIKKRKAKKIFKQAEEMDLLHLSYKKPGNMYYYIRYRTENGDNKVTWGREEHLIHPQLDSFYVAFTKLIPKEEAASSK